MNISILILTKNEQEDLYGCLQSVAWSNDIVVYDSGSTDRTHDIAVDSGARLITRPGQDLSLAYGGNEGFHRSWGIHKIPYKYPWLFAIDADERLTPEAALELQAIASNPDPQFVAYRIRRRDFFQGRHLRFAQMSSWYIRFFRPEFVRYERRINPIILVDGPIANLRYPLDHYPFSKGVADWLRRHNTYSDFESLEIANKEKSLPIKSVCESLLLQGPERRRASLKALYYSIPLRPLAKFIYIYLFRLGFLDGRPGLTYSLLIAFYELIIAVKVKEISN